MRPPLRLVRSAGLDILSLLRLEEAALRAGDGAWAFLCDGVAEPAVVLGVSGKPELQVDTAAAAAAHTPVIRRFSGGGAVVVDGGTLTVGLAGCAATLPAGTPLGPRDIMAWTGEIYGPVFGEWGQFALRENDYVFGDFKFGGNAQAISKGRWVHHTSFLWDFSPARMALLTHPDRAPAYRGGRRHDAFITRLASTAPSRAGVLDGVAAGLARAGFAVVPTSLADAEAALLDRDHHRTTRVLLGADGKAPER